LGGRDPLLELAHFGGKRRLITHRTGHPPEKRRHFGSRLRKSENVIDEQEHVASAEVTEILGYREAREADAGTSARRLVHLPEHEGDVAFFDLVHVNQIEVPSTLFERFHKLLAVTNHTAFEHLPEQVVPLTRPLTHA